MGRPEASSVRYSTTRSGRLGAFGDPRPEVTATATLPVRRSDTVAALPPAPATGAVAALFFWELLVMDSTWGVERAGVAGFDPFFVVGAPPTALAAGAAGRSAPTVLRGAVAGAWDTFAVAWGADFAAGALAGAFAGMPVGAFAAVFAAAFAAIRPGTFAGAFAAALAGDAAGRVEGRAGFAFATGFATGFATALTGAAFFATGREGALAAFAPAAGFVTLLAFLAEAAFFATGDLPTGRAGAVFLAAVPADFFAAGAAFFAVFFDATSACSFFP